MSQKDEFERVIDDPNLQLKGKIWGHAPVQAGGTIAGKAFYFRARHEEWTFSLAESEGVNPVDISFAERGFFREAPYGKPRSFAASYMAYEEAEAFIKVCAQEFLDSRNF